MISWTLKAVAKQAVNGRFSDLRRNGNETATDGYAGTGQCPRNFERWKRLRGGATR